MNHSSHIYPCSLTCNAQYLIMTLATSLSLYYTGLHGSTQYGSVPFVLCYRLARSYPWQQVLRQISEWLRVLEWASIAWTYRHTHELALQYLILCGSMILSYRSNLFAGVLLYSSSKTFTTGHFKKDATTAAVDLPKGEFYLFCFSATFFKGGIWCSCLEAAASKGLGTPYLTESVTDNHACS